MAETLYSQWNLNNIPLLGLVLESLTTEPTSPSSPRLFWNSVTGKAELWTGSAWQNLDNIPGANVIVNSMISSTAAIAESKLSLATDAAAGTGSRRTLGTGALQALPGNTTLDAITAPAANLNLNSKRIISLSDPTSATDAATKQYVDNAIVGIAEIKSPVRVVATSNVTISGPGTTIDAVTMANGDRVLLTAQTTTTENGIYVFNGSAAAMTRATDANATGEIVDGTLVAVAEGTKAGNQYMQQNTSTGAPGTWTQSWQIFSTGGQTYVAGTGLALTGNSFALSTPVAVANGGTGVATLAALKAALGVPGKYAQDSPALTAATPATITHNLGTTDIVPSFMDKSSGAGVGLEWDATGSNTMSVTSQVTLSAAALRIVVVG